jgi:hypothetical protein
MLKHHLQKTLILNTNLLYLIYCYLLMLCPGVPRVSGYYSFSVLVSLYQGEDIE